MKTNKLNTGEYASELSEKISKIETKAKTGKIRRTIFLVIILSACFGGISFGISNKNKSIEMQYQHYLEEPDRNALNNELLSYKDVSAQFENACLGNKSFQSLMGGFFFDGSEYSVFPDESGKKMILTADEAEVTLCDGLASDINVKDGFIYFRKLKERVISSYNIADKTTAQLPLNNVGQFIVCDNQIYYLDLSSSALKAFDIATAENSEIVSSGVSSFVIVGNNIIFLDDNHTLIEMNLSNQTKTTIGKNISAFSYNEKLYMQNNEKVFIKFLNKKSIEKYMLDIKCNRLLGVSETQIFVESSDGIYIFNIKTGVSEKVADGIFVGASDGKMMIYNSSDESYQVIVTD